MKIQHISALTNHVAMRDTKDIEPSTRAFFAALVIEAKLTGDAVAIPYSNLSLKITRHGGVAIFDLRRPNGDIVTSTVCCLNKDAHEDALYYVRHMQQSMSTVFKNTRTPDPGAWLFSFSFPAEPEHLMLAGEIEFYVFFSIMTN